MSRRILVIEDEPTLARLLSYNLAQEGYAVEVRDHGGEGLQEALSRPYDLIVLDLMLPGMGGMEVLERLRSEGVRTPVVILTARGAEEEIVQGLRLGADDYVTKPFGVAELLARIAAVLRRASGVEPERGEEQENVVALGGLRIYPDKYEVTVGGRPIGLRPKEFEVLLYLVKRPGVVVTRDDLMNAVWGFDYVGGQRTVDVHVSSLRKKLELDGESVGIEAIRGVGYKLVVRQPGEKAVRN